MILLNLEIKSLLRSSVEENPSRSSFTSLMSTGIFLLMIGAIIAFMTRVRLHVKMFTAVRYRL